MAIVTSVRWYLIVVWHWFNNCWCGVPFLVLLLFYALWVQFTSCNVALYGILFSLLTPGHFLRGFIYNPVRLVTIKTPSAPVSWLPCWLSGKESTCNPGDMGSTPGLGRSPGEGNGNPLQCSCLENPGDGGAWWAAVYGVTQSQTRLKRLSSSSLSMKLLHHLVPLCLVFKDPP